MDIVLRQEHKYLMTPESASKLFRRLEKIFQQDTHNGEQGYLVRSLYFDTPDDRDYVQKLDSIECRRKIRLRVYSPEASFAKLELKQKQGNNQKKSSLRVTREEAQALIRGDFTLLLRREEPFAAEMYALMQMFCYRPKVLVDYRRRAFIREENNTRITLDSDIRASESCLDLFGGDQRMLPVLSPMRQILEVKYNHFLLSYARELLNVVDKTAITNSKYVLARQITLGYNP